MYGVTDLLGNGAVGPIAVTVILAICCLFLWRANRAQKVTPKETVSEPGTPALEPVGA